MSAPHNNITRAHTHDTTQPTPPENCCVISTGVLQGSLEELEGGGYLVDPRALSSESVLPLEPGRGTPNILVASPPIYLGYSVCSSSLWKVNGGPQASLVRSTPWL